MPDLVLAGAGLSVNFGGVQALADLDFALHRGEVLGIIGPNGAGKSVLVNLITKFYQPTAGSLWLDGKDITNFSARQIGRAGIARTFQNIRLFRRMTVLENILAAQPQSTTKPFRSILHARDPKDIEEASRLLSLLGLADKANQSAAALSYGDARRLEIARALATRPKVILLDEPAAGMNEAETAALVRDIQTMLPQVEGVLLIEHDMALMRTLASRLVALSAGRKLCEGPVSAVLDHPEVRSAYLGEGLHD
jgi:branched-chain amino acid transport system ATP-binding protein